MEDNSNGFAWILVVILAIWIYNLKSDISDLNDEVFSLRDRLDSANMQIRSAQGYAWSSYDEMGEALDNLVTQ